MNHGTRSAYTRGCRCDACTTENVTYQRDRRQSAHPDRRVGPRTGELLEVECWCRARIVRVPVDDVRAGLTRPCSDRYCRATDERRRSAA